MFTMISAVAIINSYFWWQVFLILGRCWFMQMSVPEIPYNTIATKSIISKVVKISTLELNQKKKSVCYLCTKHQQIVK